MKTIANPKLRRQKPAADPHHAAAVARGKAAVKKLQTEGIIDSAGRRIRKALPTDMQADSHRDFGG